MNSLNDNQLQKLDFIKSLQKFGAEELGLKFDGSFEEVSLEEFSCNWVYSCFTDRLESTFDNKYPFEFYPDETKALSRIDELKQKGFETYFYHAEAHGGPQCPITRELLEATKARQSYVILHEAWHSTCRLDELNFDYSWEESTGRAIGLFAGIEYAKLIGDEELLKQTVDQELAWYMFAQFINAAWLRLQEHYQAKHDETETLNCKVKLQEKAKFISSKLPESWEKQELLSEVNNAFILRYHDYTVHYQLARNVVEKLGSVKAAMNLFKSMSFEEIETDFT